MPVDLQITGADQFAKLARQLRQAGDVELRRDLYRGIERSVRPIKDAVRASARQALPRKGGLNERVAKARFTTRKRSGANPGVRLVVKAGLDLPPIEHGRLRHPVFGNRSVWVAEKVPAGWAGGAVQRQASAVRRELLAVLDDVEKRLSR